MDSVLDLGPSLLQAYWLSDADEIYAFGREVGYQIAFLILSGTEAIQSVP